MADPERFDADPDPTFQADADADPEPDFYWGEKFFSSNLQLLFPNSSSVNNDTLHKNGKDILYDLQGQLTIMFLNRPPLAQKHTPNWFQLL